MRFTLLTQVVLLTLSVAIIFLFVRPALAEIKAIQDDLLVYSDAVAKAEEYNKRLQELISNRDSFSTADIAKLERFVPTTIDVVTVMHEVENIFASKDIKLTALTAKERITPVVEIYSEGESVPSVPTTAVATQDFEVNFDGDYDTLKAVLGVIEASARLLEVVSVKYGVESETETAVVTADKDLPKLGEQSFTIVLRAYALEAQSVEQPTQ